MAESLGAPFQELLKDLLGFARRAAPLEARAQAEQGLGALRKADGSVARNLCRAREVLHARGDVCRGEHFFEILRLGELRERFRGLRAVARAVLKLREERGPLRFVGLRSRGGAGESKAPGEVLLLPEGNRRDAHRSRIHDAPLDRHRRQESLGPRIVLLEDRQVTELDGLGVLRRAPPRILTRALDSLFQHRPGVVEPPLPKELRNERAARRVVVGVLADQAAQDLLPLRRAALFEEHLREETANRPVLGTPGREVAGALLGFRESAGAREVERDPFRDGGVLGVRLFEAPQELERLVEAVVVLVEVDQGGRALTVLRVFLEERLVDRLGVLHAAALCPGLRRQARERRLRRLPRFVQDARRLRRPSAGEESSRERTRDRGVARGQLPRRFELFDRGVEPRGLSLGGRELEGSEEPPALHEVRVDPHDFPRLLHGLVADVQVAKQLRVFETDDRVFGEELDDFPVEVERLPIPPLADGGAGAEECLAGVPDVGAEKQTGSERNDESRGGQTSFHDNPNPE